MSGLAEHQRRFAEALRARDLDAAPTWLGPADRARFRVYRNNHFHGLGEALAAAYPAVRRLVGDAFFFATTRAFVAAHPPRTRTLALFGAEFPAFVASFPPAASLAYLGDVARLERAVLEATHAADAEPMPADALVGLGERVADASFLPHAATRLVRSPHPIVGIWRAQQRADGRTRLAARGETALVTRPADRVLVQALHPAPAAFVATLLRGRTATEAASAANAVEGDFDPVEGWRPVLEGGALAGVADDPASHGDDA